MVVMFSSCQKSDAPDPNQIVDIDGNVYHSVIIGDQEWLVENLKVTRFNDGSSIPLVKSQLEWIKLSTPGYCWYDNNEKNKDKYGGLYNWYSVNTSKLAPTGWHVANNGDWMVLINYLGGLDFAGNELKFGEFSAVLAGWRDDGGFLEIGKKASFISKEPKEISVCVWTSYSYQDRADYGGAGLSAGLSVRCIKNKI
jgi:uncharacterized protein (TIGR02145 family)